MQDNNVLFHNIGLSSVHAHVFNSFKTATKKKKRRSESKWMCDAQRVNCKKFKNLLHCSQKNQLHESQLVQQRQEQWCWSALPSQQQHFTLWPRLPPSLPSPSPLCAAHAQHKPLLDLFFRSDSSTVPFVRRGITSYGNLLIPAVST